jgi:hypothetical protein
MGSFLLSLLLATLVAQPVLALKKETTANTEKMGELAPLNYKENYDSDEHEIL